MIKKLIFLKTSSLKFQRTHALHNTVADTAPTVQEEE